MTTRQARIYGKGDYTGYLKTLRGAQGAGRCVLRRRHGEVEDATLRSNRLALLRDLRDAMNRVADISRLASMKPVAPMKHHSRPRRHHQPRQRPVHQVAGRVEADPGQPGGDRAAQPGRLALVVATNQSGIGRGLFDMATLNAIHDKMHRRSPRPAGASTAMFYCPHAAESNCACRKPKPGLLREIASRFDVELTGVPAVGDSLRDLRPRPPSARSRSWC